MTPRNQLRNVLHITLTHLEGRTVDQAHAFLAPKPPVGGSPATISPVRSANVPQFSIDVTPLGEDLYVYGASAPDVFSAVHRRTNRSVRG